MNNKIYNELLKMCEKAAKKDEVPIAALITYKDKIIAKAYNKRNKSNRTIDHAEIICILKANAKLKNWRINECDLYVTVEPCEMCKNVIKESRIRSVKYLIPRLESKKIYNRTAFEQIKISEEINTLEKIQEITSNFWEKKRK